MNYEIQVNETTIPYSIRRSKRAKRSRIIVTPDLVEVVSPEKLSEKHIHNFIQTNGAWVLNKTKSMQRNIEIAGIRPTTFLENSSIQYQGRYVPIQIQYQENERLDIKYNNDSFIITSPTDMTHEMRTPLLRTQLQRILKEDIKQQATRLAEHYSSILNLPFNKIVIKEQKSRWGSCSSAGNININWLLIFAPKEVFEYVVLHEVCHLQHMNHSPAFWSLVESQMPDYKKHEAWLKHYGYTLSQYL